MPVIVDAERRHLSATRISLPIRDALVARPVSGRVLSVHRSAVNLAFDRRWVTIAHASLGGLPMGIALDGSIPLDRLGITPAMHAEASGERVTIDGRLVISLAGALTWSPHLPSFSLRPADVRWPRTLAALDMAEPMAPPIGFGPLLRTLRGGMPTRTDPLGARAAATLGSILKALTAGDTPQAAQIAAGLIGLGPGATPSGDDLLVGLLAGLAAAGHSDAPELARRISARAIGRTTVLAEAFLVHAGNLEFSERVHELAAALMGEGTGRLDGAVRASCAWGASSGTDLLVGMLVGIGADVPAMAVRLADAAGGIGLAA